MAKKIPKRSKPSSMRGAAMPGETASPAKEHPNAKKAVQEAPQQSKPQKEKQLFAIIDALKRSPDFAEAIVDTVLQPLVILTKDLKVRSANRAFFEAFKVAKEETENRFIYDLGNGQWNIPKLREALEKILPEKGEFHDFRAEYQFENIGRKSMLLNAREIRQSTPFGGPAILLAIEDITERRQLENERRASAEEYRILFDLGPAAVYSCDASGTIQKFNRRAVELWGREPKPGDTDEVFCGSYKMYRPDGTFMPHELCPMADVLSGKIPEAHDMEVQIERPDGSRIIAMVNIRVLKNEREEITGAINSFVDVTMLKQAENSLRNSQAGLQRANEDLKHFAYAASHDLQEPLRMITAYSQLLAREYKGKLDQKADQFIAYTVEGAQRMDALLKGMCEYWQAAERGEKRRVSVDCDEVLKKVLSNLNETVEESGATIRHDPLPVVWAEEMPLVELFQNLIANAIKYRGATAPEIHVSAAKNDHREWAFSVRDNGIGIDPRYAEKIFAVFNRLNGGKYPGSGIGLAICRKIVERLGGRIWVESELGRGSDFKFTIPPRE